MSRKHDNKGRSKGGPAFVQLAHWLRKTPAWRSLKPYSKLLYIEIKGRYNGTNNGDIAMSYREAEELLGCSNGPVIVAFRELQDRGFMFAVQKGAFSWKVRFEGAGRATTWRLTELPADWPERSLAPTLDFKNWVEQEADEKKSRRENLTPMTPKIHAIADGMTPKSHAIGVKNSRHNAPSEPTDGVKNSRTYRSTISLPSSPQPIGQPSSALIRTLEQKGWSSEQKGWSRKSGRRKAGDA